MTDNSQRIRKHLSPEILSLLEQRRSLHLSTLTKDGLPYASYAPYAIGDDCFYVLLSDLAVHGLNLVHYPQAAALIIEDEDSAEDLFARRRISYQLAAELIARDHQEWAVGVAKLVERHGERCQQLSQFGDFRLFRLLPLSGRYVKGFGKAFAFSGGTLTGVQMSHLRGGHQQQGVGT